ncbi:hypothetical protein BDZ45DRAFT_695165 [Acephala macrosclerotiorum]|nr:hypothetical protein BDZ45DRAFT_695165 [Acephala macrosclerotiorum]
MQLIKPALITAFMGTATISAAALPGSDGTDGALNFINSCTGLSYKAPCYFATCYKKSGLPQAAVINLDQCIGNSNGRMVHPGIFLIGQCKDFAKNYVDTEIDFGAFVQNNDGTLYC